MNRLLVFILFFTIFKAEAQQNVSALAVGDSLFVLGDYSKAITAYNKLINSELKQFKLAKSYEALGNNPKALAHYNNVIFNNQNATLAKYNFGKLLFKMSKLKAADSVFKILSEENSNNPNFTYYIGLVKEKQKDSMAISFFQKTIAIDSNYINAVYKIAKINIEKRRFKEAKPAIKKGLLIDSLSIRFLILKGLKHFHTKEYHEAVKTFEKLLSLGKKDEWIRVNLANSYSNVLKIEEAIAQYTILINRYDDKNPDYHYNIGKSFIALHYFKKAIKHIEIAIALRFTPLDNEYASLAQVYNRKKDYKKVIDLLEKAVSQNSNNEYALYQLATAADNYFEDKNTVLKYYERYLKKFGETGRMRELAKYRVRDLKKEIFIKD